jgi:hypothetical protein
MHVGFCLAVWQGDASSNWISSYLKETLLSLTKNRNEYQPLEAEIVTSLGSYSQWWLTTKRHGAD